MLYVVFLCGNFGYQQDADSGLKLLGHRYYDPSTGRFLTRDPIKDGRNWYAYGGGTGSPTTLYDSLGLAAITLVGGAGASAIVDGPLPFGDIVAVILLVAAATMVLAEDRPDIIDLPEGQKPPFKGKPGSIARGDKQTRVYGEDVYPLRDIDYHADHGAGELHSHDWGR